MPISSRCSGSFLFAATLLAILLGLVLAPQVNAGQNKSKTTTPAPVDERKLVTAVDVPNAQITITFQRDKSNHVYGVDGMTQVTAQGRTGTISDIKVGQQVYAYIERDDKSLDSIEVAVAEAAPVSPNAKKKS